MESYEYVNRNYRELLDEIDTLSRKYSRHVTLVAVTKSGSDSELIALADCGVSDIGENRPGELARRGALLRDAGYTPRLHEIGNLQRNKVKYIIGDVSLIHSVDNLALAMEIEKQAAKIDRTVPVLIEINSGREENKDGVMPEDAESLLKEVAKLPHISLCGLMTMGPVCEDPEQARPYFRLTKQLFDELNSRYGFPDGGVLSMGMSDSYRVAIEEGSTLVRVGRKLFSK